MWNLPFTIYFLDTTLLTDMYLFLPWIAWIIEITEVFNLVLLNHFFVTIRTSHNFFHHLWLYSPLYYRLLSLRLKVAKSTKTDRLYTDWTCFFLLIMHHIVKKAKRTGLHYFLIRYSTNEPTIYFAHLRKEACKTWMQKSNVFCVELTVQDSNLCLHTYAL